MEDNKSHKRKREETKKLPTPVKKSKFLDITSCSTIKLCKAFWPDREFTQEQLKINLINECGLTQTNPERIETLLLYDDISKLNCNDNVKHDLLGLKCSINMRLSWKMAYSIIARGKSRTPQQLESALLIIASLADLNQIDQKTGNTLLIMAASVNETEIAKLLVSKKNIDLNIQNKLGQSALMLAVHNNNYPLTQSLIARHASLRLKDANDNTALNIACIQNCYDIAKLLIENDANVDTPNRNGFTPLTCALINNNPTLVELLIQHKADITKTDNQAKTALDLTKERLSDMKRIEAILKAQVKPQKTSFCSLY